MMGTSAAGRIAGADARARMAPVSSTTAPGQPRLRWRRWRVTDADFHHEAPWLDQLSNARP